MIRKIIHIVILSCLQASFLIEKEQGGKLSFIQKKQLSYHIKICSGCKQYYAQSHILNAELKKELGDIGIPDLKLSDDAKKRLSAVLTKNS